jgi:exodeoxyribonuclease VII small subunit
MTGTTSDVAGERGGDEPVAAGYAAALAELEQILAELERADVDVDRLATQVQRAAALIGFCRERIGNARLQIEQVVAGLDDDST